MSDRDKVISRLQIIRTWAEVGKNYDGIQGENCLRDVVDWIDDALVLLKEQDNCENCAIAIEDRQPVVRCKDCKHLFNGEHIENCCDMLMEKCGWLKEISVSPDWFCADGERL